MDDVRSEGDKFQIPWRWLEILHGGPYMRYETV